jgi:hypothetical protein
MISLSRHPTVGQSHPAAARQVGRDAYMRPLTTDDGSHTGAGQGKR